MLEKSLGSNADSLAYDLEDSVAHAQKPMARKQVAAFLNVSNLKLSRYFPLTFSDYSAG